VADAAILHADVDLLGTEFGEREFERFEGRVGILGGVGVDGFHSAGIIGGALGLIKRFR
jgi:hypothetical protein